MKDLYISFTHLIGNVKSKNLTSDDLNDALFYLGCIKDHLEGSVRDNSDMCDAYNLASQAELDDGCIDVDDADLEGAVATYTMIQGAVRKAETEGRAVFRPSMDHRNSFRQLNGLLQANGIDTSLVDHLAESNASYSYRAVVENYSSLVNVVYQC